MPNRADEVPPLGTRVPVPDPTTLTTEALRRDISALRDTLEMRLDGMDKAISLQKETTDNKIQHSKELNQEQFNGIKNLLIERDKTRQELGQATAEAIKKSEGSQSKIIDQLNSTIAIMAKSVDEKNADLKDRMTRFESLQTGKTSGISGIGAVILGGLVALTTLVGVISLIFNISKSVR